VYDLYHHFRLHYGCNRRVDKLFSNCLFFIIIYQA
jgi:hypothetical protein